MKYGQKQEGFWGWLASSFGVCCDCDNRKSDWEIREWENYKQEISRSEMGLGDQKAAGGCLLPAASAHRYTYIAEGSYLF